NSGIFVFRGATLLRHLGALQPELARAAHAAAAAPDRLEELYAAMPAEPIDTAVMERLDEMHTLVLDCGWSDLGSWAALAEVLGRGDDGNSASGDVLSIDAGGNLLYADGGAVTVLGVEGLAVVQTGDAVLVLPLERSQEVRRIVAELRRRGRDDLL
ncbi:MAG: mannose-1-phosphate guanylyltransferase/mannose-6-phosphate isomerase, partial [Thermoanaerobaculia bacterium]|nr:mannose-1-phosphate guanylyltransferase/mannose-6-phosphate isomerase [Thermoanaerobaculia bacterium]